MQFTQDELVALRLGARLVKGWADHRLAEAARTALERIEAALPEALRDLDDDAGLVVQDHFVSDLLRRRVGEIRVAVAHRRKVWVRYRSATEEVSERVIRPVVLFYWGGGWTAGAWCELREGFRDFRLDRMVSLRTLAPFPEETGRGIEAYLARARATGKSGYGWE
jgi:predicted DNA-binding transcriptional regulator YafY